MSLKAGIVGLPNVGKSTLFNAITKAGVLAANYPFATIDPNVGVVEVPDSRLDFLTELYKPKKTIPTTFEFVDIAGLVKGASKGEGLGNQFLSNIREADAICEVVRCFDDSNVHHVEGSVDSLRDVEIINLELILADLAVIENRIPKIEKKARVKEENALVEYQVLCKLRDALLEEKPCRKVSLDEAEYQAIKHFHFLTLKPILYIANVSDADLLDLDSNENYLNILKYADGDKVIPICAQMEADLATFSKEEKEEFLQELGLEESGLDRLIKESYDTLGLATYFTAGEQEVRAWTFKKGMKAPQCAGIIHSDFERGFIRAETTAYDDLFECGNMLHAREKGKVRSEGKEYIVKDGDIMLFRFNV